MTKDGNTSRSIYGDVFDDEFLEERRVAPKAGVIAMHNRASKNTNGSKFHIYYAN